MDDTQLQQALSPEFIAARDAVLAGAPARLELEQLRFGQTDDRLSVIGFGGIIVQGVSQPEANNFVAEAFDRGVNYYDVAPGYGDAEEHLGPGIAPYRDHIFLACKTHERAADKAAETMATSLRRLHTDRFDLFQLHGIPSLEEAQKALGPGGALETVIRARDEGKVRYIGFSAHCEEAALWMMDQFDFDSALFPFNYAAWIKEGFGRRMHALLRERGKGILALKAMAREKYRSDADREARAWKKTWYQPLEQIDRVGLALRFTRFLPVDAMIPPGHWELFQLALDLAQAGALVPLTDAELAILEQLAHESDPIFEAARA